VLINYLFYGVRFPVAGVQPSLPDMQVIPHMMSQMVGRILRVYYTKLRENTDIRIIVGI